MPSNDRSIDDGDDMTKVLLADEGAHNGPAPELAGAIVEPLQRMTVSSDPVEVHVAELQGGTQEWMEELTDGVGYVVARCRNVEREEQQALARLRPLMEAADAADLPVGVVFDHFSVDAISDVVLSHPCVEQFVLAELIDGFDVEHVRKVLAPPDLAGAQEIGRFQRMPDNHQEYEARRVISMSSPRMRRFLVEFKGALRLMDRHSGDGLHLCPPWDPTDSNPSWVRQDEGASQWRPHGRRRPNLRDIYLAHDDEEARRWLAQQQAAQLQRVSSWESAPPKLLVLGESGTGKSLVADLAYRHLTQPYEREPEGQDNDVAPPFERISCGGLTASDLDHDLFGAPPGVFTDVGAVAGELTRASYGVAFLDEIGDLPLQSQARLLTFLDDLRIRVREMPEFFSFLQIVAATNRDLQHRTLTREFRHDLLARFRMRITLPPLRQRREDIPQLVDFVAQQPDANPVGAREQRAVTHIGAEAIRLLEQHEYRQGNFRELEEVVHHGLHEARLARSRVLEPEHLAFQRRPTYRPETAEHVIQIADSDAEDLIEEYHTRIQVSGDDELRRLADRRDRPVHQGMGPDSALVLFDGDRAYLYRPADDA